MHPLLWGSIGPETRAPRPPGHAQRLRKLATGPWTFTPRASLASGPVRDWWDSDNPPLGGSTGPWTRAPRPRGQAQHYVKPLQHCLRPLCDIPSGCCSFTGPWTVTRSSLRMLRRVAAFCRPLRPVLLLVSFPHSRSPVVGVLGLCWMWRGVPFACQRRPIIGILRMCWLLPGSFDCFCCPRACVRRPSIACLAVFLCGPGALFLHALSGPSTICSFPPHGWPAPDGLPLLLRRQPIWAAGDTPHLMPVEQGPPPPRPGRGPPHHSPTPATLPTGGCPVAPRLGRGQPRVSHVITRPPYQ